MCEQAVGKKGAGTGRKPGTLCVGDSGPAVAKVQGQLNARARPIAEDAEFGHETKGAVITFQAQNDLNPDGLVGPKTKAALEA